MVDESGDIHLIARPAEAAYITFKSLRQAWDPGFRRPCLPPAASFPLQSPFSFRTAARIRDASRVARAVSK